MDAQRMNDRGKNQRKQKYDFIFSIGAACLCTQMLRQADLQVASFPLDWVGGVSLEYGVDFILSDFEMFLRKEDLQKDSILSNARRDVYRNTRVKITMPHDFPAGASFEEEFPKVQEKYRRRIQRLYDEINKSQRILAVYVERCEDFKLRPSRERIIQLWEKLSQRYPNKQIDLRYIGYDSSCSKGEILVEALNEHILFFTADYYKINQKQECVIDHRFCLNFVKDCRIFLPFKVRWGIFWKRFLYHFIPGGRLRKMYQRYFHLYQY